MNKRIRKKIFKRNLEKFLNHKFLPITPDDYKMTNLYKSERKCIPPEGDSVIWKWSIPLTEQVYLKYNSEQI